MKIKYVTGNKIKINYANNQLNKFGIEIEQVVLDVHEIQSLEKFAVAEDKAKKAFAILNEPFFVTDTFWEIPALNGFPGAFMKYINNWFVPQDILNLMKDKNDRRIICVDSIVYIDKEGTKLFSDGNVGEISDKIYEDGEKTDSIDNTVKFNGKYLKEHHEEKWKSLNDENIIWREFAEFLKSKI